MKKLTLFIVIILLISACQNRETEVPADTQLETTKAPVPETIVAMPYSAEYNEKTQKLELKHSSGSTSKPSLNDMINAINLKYPEIKLHALNVKDSILHVKIDDATYLTQSIGTTGARIYIAEATFALTEVAGINMVDFNFAEGDHAVPGPYDRTDFKDLN